MLLIGTIIFSTHLESGPAFMSYAQVPVNTRAQLAQASELLGSEALTRTHWRYIGLGESLYSIVVSELATENRHMAGAIVTAVLRASFKHRLDPVFLLGMIKTESRFNPKTVGTHGEIGLMQIMPKTAEWISKRMGIRWRGAESLQDPETNIRLATAYLSLLRKKVKTSGQDYISAYNMGPTNVRKLRKKSIEPKIYLDKVIANYRGIHRELASEKSPIARIDDSLAFAQ